MSLLSWNCRGLGNPRIVQFLKEIVFQKKPNVVFLCETICKTDKINIVKRALGFEGSFVVEARGHSGGLAMLWKKEEEGKLISFSTNHIDLELNMDGYPTFRATGFYGEPQRHLRANTWRAIRQLSGESSLPWCLLGDLNNTLNHSDKRGGRPYPNWLLTGFQDVVSECHLIDMEIQGHPFTWEKGKGTDQWVEVRLDRALVSYDWQALFPSAILENLEVTVSDHCPIWLNLAKSKPVQVKKRFRYENAWSREPMCRQIVQARWENGLGDSLQVKLEASLWLQAGDQNTKYFHACASSRKRNNQIVRLKNADGEWVDWDNGLSEVMSNYYSNLFTSSCSNWQAVIDCVATRVSSDQNRDLLLAVEEEEVRRALFQMHPDKSHRPRWFQSPGSSETLGYSRQRCHKSGTTFLFLW
ncbi:uncharacterized protein LOC133034451 [Cannabis sativa]|uniref:uncharacterized protein LOC133034451 n=1 Tax=Cannabis sativa TaxID=3483 RepID=UPI0029C9E5C8|nr:uncharacterized protein LOC133034451 [Cannabis sativa]